MKLTSVDGVGVMNGFKLLGSVRVRWSAFGIGDIPSDPIMEGFTLEDIEHLIVEGVGGDPDPSMKALKFLTFGIGDILADPSAKEFTLGVIKLLGVEGMGDWFLVTLGGILGDPSVKEFTLGGIKLLEVEGMGDWDFETVGDILWDLLMK